MLNLDTIQSLWVGDHLSVLEQMCIASYLVRGHRFHLYTYGDVANVPHNCEIKNANKILPESSIARFQNLANFSDYFRYALLYLNGGYWVDLDNFCLKPYDFVQEYVFSSQLTADRGMDEGNAGVSKVPKESKVIEYCLTRLNGMNVKTTEWAALGPILLREAYAYFNLQKFMQPRNVFCPLNYFEAPANVVGTGTWNYRFPEETYSVHLWNEELRRAGVDKDAKHPNSLFERLKAMGR